MKYRRIDTHFRETDEGLYNFVISLTNGWGDVSQIMREAIKCYQWVYQTWNKDWWIELHQAAFALKWLREKWQDKWPSEVGEAAQALELVREMFGANWQEEWQKLKDVAEKM